MANEIKYDENKPLKIIGGKSIKEFGPSNMLGSFSPVILFRLEKLYVDLEPQLKSIGMNTTEFMQQIKSAFARYQEHKSIDFFTPMDNKGLKYIEKFMTKTIHKVADSIQQDHAKKLTR